MRRETHVNQRPYGCQGRRASQEEMQSEGEQRCEKVGGGTIGRLHGTSMRHRHPGIAVQIPSLDVLMDFTYHSKTLQTNCAWIVTEASSNWLALNHLSSAARSSVLPIGKR